MGDSAYVFYCSRCKVDHGGECPPAKKKGDYETVIIKMKESLKFVPIVLSFTGMPNGAPPPAPPTFWHSIGTKCNLSFRRASDGFWMKNRSFLYEVVAVHSDGSVDVRDNNNGMIWHAGTDPAGIPFQDTKWDRIKVEPITAASLSGNLGGLSP